MPYIPSRAEALGTRIRQLVPDININSIPQVVGIGAGVADAVNNLAAGESLPDALASGVLTGATTYGGNQLGMNLGGRAGTQLAGMPGSVVGSLSGAALGGVAGNLVGQAADDEAIKLLNQHLGVR